MALQIGNPCSKDHPKDHPLCFVDWTCNVFFEMAPKKYNIPGGDWNPAHGAKPRWHVVMIQRWQGWAGQHMESGSCARGTSTTARASTKSFGPPRIRTHIKTILKIQKWSRNGDRNSRRTVPRVVFNTSFSLEASLNLSDKIFQKIASFFCESFVTTSWRFLNMILVAFRW